MWMPLLVLVQQEVVDLFQSVVSAIAPSLVAEEGMCVCANEDGDEEEKVAAAGGEYRVSTSAKRASSNLTPKKDVSGIGDTETLAGTVESQKLDNEELLSHSPSLKIGQLKKFVYKNYSLHGR
ncbi:unnamed protein product [Sphagnum troendelagicum]